MSTEMIQMIHNVCQTFEKISNTSVIFLSEEFVRIAAVSDNEDSTKCYAEMQVFKIFTEYRIESQVLSILFNRTLLY